MLLFCMMEWGEGAIIRRRGAGLVTLCCMYTCTNRRERASTGGHLGGIINIEGALLFLHGKLGACEQQVAITGHGRSCSFLCISIES